NSRQGDLKIIAQVLRIVGKLRSLWRKGNLFTTRQKRVIDLSTTADRERPQHSALHLQHRGQSDRTGSRRGNFCASPVTHAHAVKPVAVMGDLFYCIQAHHSMPSDLDKGVAP